MTATLFAALCAQVLAISLLCYRLGWGMLRRPVPWLVIMGCLYHGVSAVSLWAFSLRSMNPNQEGIDQHYVDLGDLLLSASLLALTVCYLATGPARADCFIFAAAAKEAKRLLDWRVISLICLPLLVVTYRGQGLSSVAPLNGTATPLSTDVATTFLELLIILGALGFIVRFGAHWFLPALVLESILLAAVGERMPVITCAGILLLLAVHLGMRLSPRQIGATILVTALAVIGLTGYRSVSGRQLFYENSGLKARAEGVTTGLIDLSRSPANSAADPSLAAQAAIRFDGDSFAGGILQSMRFGQPAVGLGPAAASLLLDVPSMFWSTKLMDQNLNPAAAEISDFGLQQLNFLPTLSGLYVGFLGPLFNIAFLALCGLCFGFGERLLFRRGSLPRLIVLAGAFGAAGTYEAGLPTMLLELRAAAAVALLVKVIQMISKPGRKSRRRSRSASRSWVLEE